MVRLHDIVVMLLRCISMTASAICLMARLGRMCQLWQV
jgi:hypothetical protein